MIFFRIRYRSKNLYSALLVETFKYVASLLMLHMTKWKFISSLKSLPKLNNPVLIIGLPGIGNVGKVVADFIVEDLKAKKLYDIFSHEFPHSVYVTEQNLVELPNISLYYKAFADKKKRDILVLVGDVQPISEESCYDFVDALLEKFIDLSGTEVITLAGIGLKTVPEKPLIYCTGNSKKLVSQWKNDTNVRTDLFGFVGPIVGVSGVSVGLAKLKSIPAVCLLAETFGHPMYVGVNGSKEIINILNKKLKLNIDVKRLDKELRELESELSHKAKDLRAVTQDKSGLKSKSFGKGLSYIG